jgi:hypothetical protein
MKTTFPAMTLALGIFSTASGIAQSTNAAPQLVNTPVAPGGGAGKVWINIKTRVYSCEGSRSYGKSRKGEYMNEVDTKVMGYNGKKGQASSK